MVDHLRKRLLPHLDLHARKMVHDTIDFPEEQEGIGVNFLCLVDLALGEFRTAIAAETSEKRVSSTASAASSAARSRSTRSRRSFGPRYGSPWA
ncbi:hypothetical protein LCGC14_2975930 [marine sediment metagenome]|uniref:Uncharacterized protein n=1 Tax=marine sediment metagenome TaxID=412755 RepID=A0A0F8ZZB5_9ZZZZ